MKLFTGFMKLLGEAGFIPLLTCFIQVVVVPCKGVVVLFLLNTEYRVESVVLSGIPN